ncbi:Hypothetical protein I595_1771 [Croceitalea dokdonensis DOKDO 023]|uniref:Uncharacterized protein n=1 Tax=Croceitalea dokdonensis DOKDO 023 TaxID=1300341 RepID=A0A0P7B216_9FLAO|nr:Hypothetical protein I595_1771 [Croceitalea dokdonensis DOKDO 023]
MQGFKAKEMLPKMEIAQFKTFHIVGEAPNIFKAHPMDRHWFKI